MGLLGHKELHSNRSVITLEFAIWLHSLAPGKFEWNFRHVILKQILVTDGWGISCEIAQIWMSLDFTDDQSTLAQVMAWCRQATSHYLSQCWSRSLSSLGHNELKPSVKWVPCLVGQVEVNPALCVHSWVMQCGAQLAMCNHNMPGSGGPWHPAITRSHYTTYMKTLICITTIAK